MTSPVVPCCRGCCRTAQRIRRRDPPGDPIPINIEPFDVADGVQPDLEIRVNVKGLSNGRTGGASFMRAENLKEWLRGQLEEEQEDEEKAEAARLRGAGTLWRTFVRLIQSIWETGVIPQQLLWVIVVLIPKGGGDYRGIGLLEPIWKVLEAIMDKR